MANKKEITIKAELGIEDKTAEEQVVALEAQLVKERSEKDATIKALGENLKAATEANAELSELNELTQAKNMVKTIVVNKEQVQVLPGKIKFEGKEYTQEQICANKVIAAKILDLGGDFVKRVKDLKKKED